MSKADILQELPRLTREERREVVRKIHELDGDEWWDDGALTGEEKARIEARVAEHERDPASALPWAEFAARLNRRLGQ